MISSFGEGKEDLDPIFLKTKLLTTFSPTRLSAVVLAKLGVRRVEVWGGSLRVYPPHCFPPLFPPIVSSLFPPRFLKGGSLKEGPLRGGGGA